MRGDVNGGVDGTELGRFFLSVLSGFARRVGVSNLLEFFGLGFRLEM